MGPFVDADHPRVRSGDIVVVADDGKPVALTARDLWELRAAPAIEGTLMKPQLAHTQLVLMPAWNDALTLPLLPQPALTDVDLRGFYELSVRKVRGLPMCVRRTGRQKERCYATCGRCSVVRV